MKIEKVKVTVEISLCFNKPDKTYIFIQKDLAKKQLKI